MTNPTEQADLFESIPSYKALALKDRLSIWRQISLMSLNRASRGNKILEPNEIQKHASESGHPEIFLDCLGVSLNRSLEKLTSQ